ncbi:MAG TPA: DNA gyrase subunit A [Firmicutes bacterium]|nr:DNA gyrase subunit A [Bacillota bacterium]
MSLDEGKIITVDIDREMRHSYLTYAMTTIIGRAIPDARDGLKPVHRRILYGMYETGTTPDKPYKKSARIAGDVMGRYHPHGDAAIYDSMVRMAQDFSYRYPLVDGHGNFGSVDGDPPAASRYTEARLSKVALHLLAEIEKETVDFIPNYDESMQEPTVLPSRFPNLLVNGSAGIAVGMATNIPPHNLGEVIDGAVLLIDNPEAEDEELLKIVKGPDFPTAGIILGREGIRDAYLTGRGSIKVRARAKIEPMSGNKHRILVTEIPYQVNKAKLVERIAELVRDKVIDGITDLRDESDRTGMRIVIELRRDVNPNIILNLLYKHTSMQDSFGVIMLALVNGQPRVLTLRECLNVYLEHQQEVVTRRTRYDLRKAEERAHILEGLRIALDHIDAIIKLIRASRTVDEARDGLMENFGLSDKQAQAILDMRLQRLTGLERDKIEAEYQELIAKIAYYKDLLSDVHKLMGIVKQEMLEIRDKYSEGRRTEITIGEGELEIEDLIAEEDIVITATYNGYIKRTPVGLYRNQKRGGRGISGISTREEDFVIHLFVTTTHDYVLFFTNQGRVYQLKGHEIPETGRQARGTAIINLINVEPGERVTAILTIRDFDDQHTIFMGTRFGVVKKTLLSEFSTNRKTGLIAIGLDDGDELIGAEITDGEFEVMMATRRGQSIRFHEDQVRAMGRNARGVKGITLDENDFVIGMDVVKLGTDLLVVTEKGYGKRTAVDEYRLQSRGGKGIKTLRIAEKNGLIVGMRVVSDSDEMMFVTALGVLIRMKVKDISRYGRDTQGVKIMKLDDEDFVTTLALVAIKDDEDDVQEELF